MQRAFDPPHTPVWQMIGEKWSKEINKPFLAVRYRDDLQDFIRYLDITGYDLYRLCEDLRTIDPEAAAQLQEYLAGREEELPQSVETSPHRYPFNSLSGSF